MIGEWNGVSSFVGRRQQQQQQQQRNQQQQSQGNVNDSEEEKTSTTTTTTTMIGGGTNNNNNENNNNNVVVTVIPKTMVDALDMDDPYQALLALSNSSKKHGEDLSQQLLKELQVQQQQQQQQQPNDGGSGGGGSTGLLSEFVHKDITTTKTIVEGKEEETKDDNNNNTNTVPSSSSSQQPPPLPITTAMACSDSIFHSLTKIATGGSLASKEIKNLELEKRELDQHMIDVETALILRKASDIAVQSLSASKYIIAAEAISSYIQQQQLNRITQRARIYAGEYTITQLESTLRALQSTILEQYQLAVETSNLQSIGKLTPLVQMIQLEKQTVALYLRFLKDLITNELNDITSTTSNSNNNQTTTTTTNTTPFGPMAKIYNCAVTTLRHHLPMVSHCLHRADGDAAVVQLVHVQVEQAIGPLFTKYIQSRQLPKCASNSQQIYSLLEERYSGIRRGGGSSGSGSLLSTGGGVGTTSNTSNGGITDDIDDCGFSTQVGTLADVDNAMEETALCLQNAESYIRFLDHTIREVNKARELRHKQEQEQKRMERDRKVWSTGMSSHDDTNNNNDNKDSTNTNNNNNDDDDDLDAEYKPCEILPAHTQLHEVVAEVGGYYSVIERCLLIASMQRAFSSFIDDDPRQYSPMATSVMNSSLNTSNDTTNNNSIATSAIPGGAVPTGNSTTSSSSSTNTAVGSNALQTSIVETCLYAAKRGTQRAFATGHTGTASAVTNFCSDCLRGVLLEVLSYRAEELGVYTLKPGDGLITGSTNLFFSHTATKVSHAVGGVKSMNDIERQRHINQRIAYACATINDLDVAAHHTIELERMLLQSIEQGFSSLSHDTEQLKLCVKSLSSVKDSFLLSSKSTIDSLISILKPRIRSIVSDAVGTISDNTASSLLSSAASSSVTAVTQSAGLMGNTVGVGVGVGSHDRTTVRMNYNLDEEAYQLLEVSEGYISRLCNCLDEMIVPICTHLSPRLSDELVLGVLGTAAKRLEVSLKRCHFTFLGALSLDSDIRDLVNYVKGRLNPSSELSSNNIALYRASTPLARLMQIAKLLTVDDLEDVLDLMSSSKRKGLWDLSLEEVKSLLTLRIEFESDNVNELLRLPSTTTTTTTNDD